MKKTISVCIFSYNYSHLVAHAIESVLSQTRKADKIYVIDDGAKDGVDRVLQKYVRRTFSLLIPSVISKHLSTISAWITSSSEQIILKNCIPRKSKPIFVDQNLFVFVNLFCWLWNSTNFSSPIFGRKSTAKNSAIKAVKTIIFASKESQKATVIWLPGIILRPIFTSSNTFDCYYFYNENLFGIVHKSKEETSEYYQKWASIHWSPQSN